MINIQISDRCLLAITYFVLIILSITGLGSAIIGYLKAEELERRSIINWVLVCAQINKLPGPPEPLCNSMDIASERGRLK